MANTLLLFPHSHFCEKARWALDHACVSYRPQPIPCLHVLTVKSKGCRGTSVPVFIEDGEAPQAIEPEMDRLLGLRIRTILYSTLLQHPEFVHFCFTHGMSAGVRWARDIYREHRIR